MHQQGMEGGRHKWGILLGGGDVAAYLCFDSLLRPVGRRILVARAEGGLA